MEIKHMPSGLFPHFDSGLERRPFFVTEGDSIIIFGCRLDGSQADGVNMEVKYSSGSKTVCGVQDSVNDRGQRYFRFQMEVPSHEKGFSYQFVTSDKEASQTYYCPIIKEWTLVPDIEKTNGGFILTYQTDTQKYRMIVQISSCIRIILTDNLTVKIDDNCENYEQIDAILDGDNRLVVLRGDQPVMRLSPVLQLAADANGTVQHITLTADFLGNAFYGLGEKFDRVNQRGKTPLNYVVEQFSHQEDKTYLPIPFVYSDAGVSLLQNSTTPSRFDLTQTAEDGWMQMKLFAVCAEGDELFKATIQTGTPQALLQAYHQQTGAPVLPPKWCFGPWMSSNGWNTQKEALEQIDQMQETGIPASVMVLEAWSDEETFYIWNDAIYTPRADGSAMRYADFTFPEDGKWPDPMAFCNTLKDNDVKLVLWQIPVVKYEANPHGVQLDLDEKYAIDNELLLKKADGEPYRITEMWFGNSLIPDFSNTKTRKWWFDKRRYLMEELGVAGFKTDGGEFLFDIDARFSDGRSVRDAHNDYPNLYEGGYHEFMKEFGGVTFSRAGYTGAQRYPIHWAGDQVSDFAELKGQLTAGLSLGLSGVPFYGFDIGGFAGDFPSTELYLRSAAFAAFAPIMQFHSEPRYGQYYMVERDHWNNDRSPWNMAVANKDDVIIPIYRLFANLRMNLMPYIWQEAQNCCQTARPMMAHLIFDYSENSRVRDIEDEYMFGSDLLVAPIIEENATQRVVYLPDGAWYGLWSGIRYNGNTEISVSCGLQRIPVFVKEGAAIPVNLNNELCMGSLDWDGVMTNRLEGYQNLAFLLFGSEGEHHFADEYGNDFVVEWSANQLQIHGKQVNDVLLFPMSGNDAGDVNGTFFGRTVHGWRKEK